MGMRAIPASRFLSAHVTTCGIGFIFKHGDDQVIEIDPIVVFNNSMYLPAIIAQAEALAKFIFGSTFNPAEVLGVKRIISESGVLGVEADTSQIDGTPEGMFRSFLLARASELVLGYNIPGQANNIVNLTPITAYYRGEGAAAVRGECPDVLVGDIPHFEMNQ